MKTNKKIQPIVGILVVLFVIVIIGALYYLNLTETKIAKNPGIKIYFIKGEKLEQVSRAISEETNPLEAAAAELMRGPNNTEKQAGIFTEIPVRTKIINIVREGDAVAVTFNDEIENYGGGSARVQGLVAQIVYTFTEIPGIKKVKILVGNKTEVVLGGEGFVIDRPLSRDDLNAR